jgi:hypothetical protein
MPDDLPPVPSNFGLQYIGWWCWCNIISILSTLQAAFTAITLDPTLVDHTTFHVISICNMVAVVIIAQVKKNNPPPPPPSKGQ